MLVVLEFCYETVKCVSVEMSSNFLVCFLYLFICLFRVLNFTLCGT